ncbi:class III lanthipeptide [Actinacidiphila epipremni]|nr:class III lanthipeptide [Actinacidiphila epipremni]
MSVLKLQAMETTATQSGLAGISWTSSQLLCCTKDDPVPQ